MVAALIMSADNRHGRVGVRIHDIAHPLAAGHRDHRRPRRSAPGLRDAAQSQWRRRRAHTTRRFAARGGSRRPRTPIPAHVLIETYGALREVWEIAALPEVESLDFGLMDFVSGHHGAIPASAMRSPGQFEHPLIVRAKCEIAAAALANGVVPSHNVTTELRDLDFIRNDAGARATSSAICACGASTPTRSCRSSR
jgi:citrate lyase subunit beta/citryl-CoA lyase